MKKLVFIVTTIIFIVLLGISAFAYTNNIFVDGKTIKYDVKDILINIDGKNFDTGNTPPLIINDSTLVPVRAISEGEFKSNVNWDEKNKKVTITKDKKIVLTIGSDIAEVDGKQIKLIAPARIITIGKDGYTYIPFRFLFETFGYKVEWNQANYEIKTTAPPPKIIAIKDVKSTINNGVLSLNIIADGPMKYTQGIIEETGNIRNYLDIDNAILEKGKYNIDINTSGIKNAVIAQNQMEPTPKVRAVAYLSNTIPYTITQSDDKTTITISYDVGTSYVTGINFEKQENTDKIVIMSDASNINTFRDGNNKIVVDITGSILKMPDGLKAGQINVQGDSVTAIRYSQYSKDVVRIAIDTNSLADFKIISDKNNIIMYVVKPKPNQKPLIYIDPGHGGTDPGAIGIGGIRESDITLGISLKLNELLTKNGFRTKLSRESDIDVGLDARSQDANNSGADVFISIHANAFSNPQIKGTEVYSYPQGLNGDIRDNKTFAQIVHDNLIKQINTNDRGIKEAKFSVLTKTIMPAILIETAFVTNPDDAALLQDDAFQWKVAQGIYNGIVEYFKGINDKTISKTIPFPLNNTTVNNDVYNNK